MTGYIRQSIFTSGDVIRAADGNDEFNQIVAFASQNTGHKHDGTSAEGAYVPLISNAANTDKLEIVTGGAKTTGTHQVTGLLSADAGITVTGTTTTGVVNTTGDTTVTGNVIVTGTVDGRDVLADGTALDAHIGAGGAVHAVGTVSTAGFMSAADKTKLDSLTIATSSGITNASLLPFTPAGTISSTDTQAAIEEVATGAATSTDTRMKGQVWVVKTGTYTAVHEDAILANTTAGIFTITLPVTPTADDYVDIADYAGTFSTNNLTVARNGENIMGLAEDMTISTNNVSIRLVYADATQGWRVL